MCKHSDYAYVVITFPYPKSYQHTLISLVKVIPLSVVGVMDLKLGIIVNIVLSFQQILAHINFI
jgi:hypothetical protein